MACSGVFGTPGWVRTSGLSLRRRPLYPTELRGLIQKIFNFTGLQDSNDSIFRRRTLYPGEVRGLIQKLFSYTRLRDSNGSIVRRRSLYTTELQGHMQKYSIVQLWWTRDRRMLGGGRSIQLSYRRIWLPHYLSASVVRFCPRGRIIRLDDRTIRWDELSNYI